MIGPGTYWRTLRHLKPGQFIHRITFRLLRPKPDLRPAPQRRDRSGPWELPARRAASIHEPATFDLLGEQHALADVGWDDLSLAKLWRYHQHYFDDLNAEDAPRRRDLHATLIDRWITENAPGCGTGWDPYPVSLRIVNWIKWSLTGMELPAAVNGSLAVQVRWLSRRLERHLLGNHLFANAKALVFAGLFFSGPEASNWLRQGLRILEREVAEQILGDGGQFERSPMYHALAVEDSLDLLNVAVALGGDEADAEAMQRLLAPRIAAMLAWLLAMSHPDGTLGRFNDCADGVAPSTGELLRLAAAVGHSLPPPVDTTWVHLPSSGYIRVEQLAMVALLDVAPVGPDYLPGHAHADTLSFELSLHGRKIIVNSGTSRYDDSPQRRHERSTAAHSTVEVASTDSSEVWASFRVGRRALPSRPSVARRSGECEVVCSHDGYAHLPGRPRHERRWRFAAGRMTVTDSLGASRLPAVARFHLAPDLEFIPTGPQSWSIEASTEQVAHVVVSEGTARIESSRYAPRFGLLIETRCLAVSLSQGLASSDWTWKT